VQAGGVRVFFVLMTGSAKRSKIIYCFYIIYNKRLHSDVISNLTLNEPVVKGK
jgi:hypothetical protein